MVFADLSGFTDLSERLGRRGKEGAEILTDVISDTFAELLGPPYEVGGSLLKFGGDALLLFFEGEEHENRACYAASDMRRRLRQVASPGDWAGTVRLRMSVGIHSDVFHFFVVRGSHDELVVAGPAVTRTCEMEGTASAGEILLSRETAAAVPESRLGVERAGGRRLSRPPPRPSHEGARSGRSGAFPHELRRFVPVAVREHLEGGGHEAEHRLVTSAFLRYSGIDRQIEEEGAETVAKAIDEALRAVQDVADEYGIALLGSDVYEDGFKILMTAGAPRASEDDEERMLRGLAELDLASMELQVQAGVNRGYVFAGDVGPPFRRAYTVMGDAVNTAARVMQHASRGAVLATSEVLGRSTTVFETEEVPEFTAKGKARPVRALLVGRPTAERRASASSHDGPFVGRAAELNELVGVLEGARAGGGDCVQVVGELGMGKSRLIAEATRRVGIRMIEVRGVQYEAGTPYAVVRRLLLELLGAVGRSPDVVHGRLRATVARVDPDLEPWIPLLAVPLDVDVPSTPEVDRLDERFVASRMREAFVRLVLALVDEPTCVVVEDAQWLDEASAGLLAPLASEVPKAPIAVVLACRALLGGPFDGVRRGRILLGPLDDDEALALIRTVSGRMLPQQARTLAGRTGGNPLFLVELGTGTSGFLDVASLPESLESLVAVRIDELPPRDRELLRSVSVLGAEFPTSLLDALSGEMGVAPSAALGRLDAFLDRSNGTVRFHQAVFQEAAYEGLAYRRRRRLHLRIGEALEAQDAEAYTELLSVHFHLAGDAARSWRYSRTAGHRAWEAFAFSEAAAFFRRAVEAAPSLGGLDEREVAGAWHALGRVARLSGAYGEAVEAYRRARRRLSKPEDPLLARLCFDEGNIRELRGRFAQALRWYGRGLRILPEETDDAEVGNTRVRLLGGRANVRYFQGRYRECVAHCREALGQAERIDDVSGMAHIRNILFLAAGWLDDMDVHACGEQALVAARGAGNPTLEGFVLNNLGELAYREGRWDRALHLYDEARRALRTGGDVVGAATVQNNVAEILFDQGRIDEARAGFEESEATARAAGFAALLHVATRNLGRVTARAGDFEGAVDLLRRAVEGLEGVGAHALVQEARWAVAESLVLGGRYVEALEELEGIPDGGAEHEAAWPTRLRGCALLGCGDLTGARVALQRSLALGEGSGSRFDVALAHEVLGRLAQVTGEGPSEHEAKAQEIFEELGVVRTPDVPLPEPATT